MAIITNTTSFTNLYSNKNRETGDSLPNPSIGSTWIDYIANPSVRFDNVQVGLGASANDSNGIKAYVGFATTSSTYTIARQYSNWLEATNLNDKMPENKNVEGILIRIKKSTTYDYPSGDYAGVKDVNAFISHSTPEIISNSNKALSYRNDIWPTSGSGYTDYGGSNDLWGYTSLTTTQLNSSDFKFLFQVSWDEQGVDKSMPLWGIDHLQVVVYYDSATNLNTEIIDTTQNILPPLISPGPVYIREQNPGIPTAETISAPKLIRNIKVDTIPTVENIGTPKLNRTISPSTIPSTENFSISPGSGRPNIVRRLLTEQISSTELVTVPSLYARAKINPITIIEGQIDSSELKTYAYIYPDVISEGQIDPPTVVVRENTQIITNPNDNNIPPGVHELIKPEENIVLYNQIYSPAYEMGYFDCLALGRDINIDPHYDLAFSNLNTDYFFSVDNLKLDYSQSAAYEKRLAGEGASPTTFSVNQRNASFSFRMPVKIESWGYVDPAFAALYDYCIQGYKGNSTVFTGRLKYDSDAAIGSTSFMRIDNIADFTNLGSNFTAYIRCDDDIETGETVTVSSVDKTTKRLYFASNTTLPHTPSRTYIWASPTNPETNREPSFSLFSLREGLFSGCMVDSINISITPGNNIYADITIKYTDLDRKYQKQFLSEFDTIVANINNRRPNYLLNGSLVSMEFANSAIGYFKLGRAPLSKYFHGFQEYDIRNFEINEMSLNISNNLKAVYSLNAKSSSSYNNFNKNSQPYAYYSDGRSITGTITYSSPIKPWLFAEKLAGTSELNKNGIRFNFGPFKLDLPDIVWSPQSSDSSMDSVHKKTVNWAVVTPKLTFDPYLTSTGNY